jgi:NAD(P)-dependent dehydrogenase (short-subunit alcohol dehydrogenase family)
LFDLKGHTAIVTGSSRGIGKAIAEAFYDAGANVVISSRTQSDCDEVAAEINKKNGSSRAIAIAANISDKSSLEHLTVETRRQFGQIDILVCNAASNPHYGSMLTITDAKFRKILENNILSNHWLISMIAPEMLQRRNGSIIIISSVGGFIGSDQIGVYNISKAADFQLVRNLAVEFGPSNVRVNAIAPGVIRTDFAKALWDSPDAERALQLATPLGRIGEPVDIAGAALFLASSASAYVTGQSIIVDGGSTISGKL